MRRDLLWSTLSVLALELSLPGAVAGFSKIELTGLIDIGSCRAACLSVEGNTYVLHPGQTARDITLKELDAKAGWALVLEGTNQTTLRVSNRPAAPPSSDRMARSLALQAEFGGPLTYEQTARQPNEGFQAEVAPNPTLPSYSVPPGGYTSPWLESYLAMERPSGSPVTQQPAPRSTQTASAATPSPSTTAEPPVAENSSVTTDKQSGMPASQQPSPRPPDPSTAPAPADATSPAVASTDTAPTQQASSANPPVSAEDALNQEGEMIRGFYGIQAFLAWDMAHPDRNQHRH